MLTNFFANLLIKPGLSPVLSSPSEYSLPYENVTFKTEDNVTLSGWLIKGTTDKIIIQSHFGVQGSRSGYTPNGKGVNKMYQAPIYFLKYVKHLNELGYSILMYDFRNHGNSGVGSPPFVTWGYIERLDLVAAINFVLNRSEYKQARIGLLSLCMGAAATTYAYYDKRISSENISALIIVSPLVYSDYVNALGIPQFLSSAVTKETTRRLGFNLNEKSFLPGVPNINVPTLLIQNKNDPWANMSNVFQLYDDLTVQKELKLLDLEKNRAEVYHYMTKNPQILSEFFNRYMM